MIRGRRPHLDLVDHPFTLPGSRVLVIAAPDGHGVRLVSAEFETPREQSRIVSELHLLVGGAERQIEWASPAIIAFEGGESLVFVDEGSLSLSIPEEGAEILLDFVGPATVAGATGSAPTDLPGRVVRWVVDGAAAVPRPARADAGSLVIETKPAPPGARLLISITDEGVGIGDARLLAHADAIVRAAAAWQAWFDRKPPVRSDLAPTMDLAWWVLGANQVRIRHDPGRMLIVPSLHGPIAALQWEAGFIAAGLRHGFAELAWDQLSAFLDHPLPDGRLPDLISDAGVIAFADPGQDAVPAPAGGGGGAAVELARPPLLAWAAGEVARSLDDNARLAWGLSRIEAAHRWFTAHGTGAELDLAVFLAVQEDRMARLAQRLGRARSASAFEAQAAGRVAGLVADHWDGATGRFRASPGDTVAEPLTIGHLLPLLTGRLPGRVAGTLAAALKDPARFWPRFPVPTLAIDDPDFDPDDPWRGAAWLPFNRLLVDGLASSNHRSLAMELAEWTLAMVVQGTGLPESWNSVTGRPATSSTASSAVSAAVFVDLAAAVSSGGEPFGSS